MKEQLSGGTVGDARKRMASVAEALKELPKISRMKRFTTPPVEMEFVLHEGHVIRRGNKPVNTHEGQADTLHDNSSFNG